MLLIVDLSTRSDTFPMEALKQVEAALRAVGFKKEVQSVVKPGKEFSITYDGPNMEKSRVQELLRPVAEQNQVNLSVEVEESVKFP
jgi:allophanate hydrolase subunit 1